MKKLWLAGIVSFVIVQMLQTGCTPQQNKETEAKNRAITLENKAKYYQKVGETDSAFKYYSESVEQFKNLQAKRTDTLYCRRIAFIYKHLGYMKDSLNFLDTAIYYYTQMMNWGDKANLEGFRIMSRLYIGATYFELAEKNKKNPADYKRLTENGLRYAIAGSRIMDSLGHDETNPKLALTAYGKIKWESQAINDTVHERFYEAKFRNLFLKTYGYLPKESQ